MAVPRLGTVVSGRATAYATSLKPPSLKPADTDRYITPHPDIEQIASCPNPFLPQSTTSVDCGNDNRPRRLPREMFRVGGIVRAALHEQDFRGTSATTNMTMNTNITESRFGNIHTKFRKMIIVSLHEENYVAIPLFTHNGKGLAHKRNPNEFVSVFDSRNPGPYVPLSSRGALMTKFVTPGIHAYDPKSTAHLTYPVSRSYTLPVVYEGHLDSASTSHLISLYAHYSPKLPLM